MKTFPSGWSTYIDGSFTVSYAIRITTQDSTVYRWGTQDSGSVKDNWPGGRITKNGLGAVSYRADIRKGGGLAIIGDFDFKILNHDDYYDTTLSAHDLSNALVEVWRVMQDITPSDESDFSYVFVGRVDDYWRDREFIYFKCRSDETEHKTIPRTIIDDKEFSSFEIPENSRGKPVPIQFGEVEKAECVFANADTTVEDGPNVATAGSSTTLTDTGEAWGVNAWAGKDLELIGGTGKGELQTIATNTATVLTIDDVFQTNPAADATVYQITDTQFDLIVSDQEIKKFINSATDPEVWFWDDTAKIYVMINKQTIEVINDSSPFTDQAGIRFLPGIVKRNEITFFYPYPFTELRYTGAWTDPDNAIDWGTGADRNLYATDPIGAGGLHNPFQGRLETDLSDVIGTWDGIFVYCIGYQDKAATNTTLEVEVWDKAANSIGQSIDNPQTVTGLYFNSVMKYLYPVPTGFPAGANATLMDVSANAVATLVEAGDWPNLNHNRWFEVNLKSSNPFTYNIRIYECGLMFTKTVPLNEKTRFFANIQGRIYGDSWGGRKTSAFIVDNSADVIEKILRDDLNVAGADIDTTAFDAITGTDRPTWQFAYSINKERESLKEIEDICKELFCVYFKKYDGKHTIKALKTSGSADKNLDEADVLCQDDDERTSTFKVRHSLLSEVYNEFFVHYDKDPATGDYHGLVFAKEPDAGSYSSDYVSTSTEVTSDLYGNEEDYWDKIDLSEDTYGFKRTMHIYLDRIKSVVAAENVLCFAIDWFSLRKAEVSFYTQLQNCDLEIGDLIGLPAALREDTYWLYGIEEDLSNDTIFLEMREL